MALLSLSIKRPSEFLEVPPSPPQSPPVVDAEFSPPSPAASTDSPISGFLRLPLPQPASFHGGSERAKKRRKQERPSLFLVDQNSAADDDDPDNDPVHSDAVDHPANCVPPVWNVMTESGTPTATKVNNNSRGGTLAEPVSDPPRMDFPKTELHPSTAIVKPVQTDLKASPSSSSVQSSTSSPLSSILQQFQTTAVPPASVYPSSPAVGRGGGGSDGEGEGSDGGVPETCPECRKVFKRRVYLQRHMAREHWSTAKVFKCDKCAYETKHQSNLLVHRRTHTGERPYHCGACGQRYTQGHLLKAHIRSRHGAEMAYYNMDKRSDGIRCRRSLAAASRLDPPGLLNPGLKEDKIRFLLEAAEAARGTGGGGPRAPVPPPAAPFAGMSLGQYVTALSSCLPGTGGIRPLLWTPTQPFQPLPHDGVTSHAALLSSLAAAPMPAVSDTNSASGPVVPGRSILNSLLASYATGSPLFSINGLSGQASSEVVGTSPLRCPSSDGPSVPQDLSMNGGGSDSRRGGLENPTETSFLCGPGGAHLSSGPCSTSAASLASDYLPAPVNHGDNPGPDPRVLNPPTTDFRASSGSTKWTEAVPRSFDAMLIQKMEEQATDLSMRNTDVSDANHGTPAVRNLTDGTVDLSSRTTDLKPCTPPTAVSQFSASDPPDRESARADSRQEVVVHSKDRCCGSDAAGCPHLEKLKELRRNVYRMLSVFTPYLDVAGAGIADVEADAVDDFLHEVIYSSKLDSATG